MPVCNNWSSIWFSGQEIDKDCLFWGVKLLWWARFGKLVQFFSGLVILADIVGIERIRKWGKSLENLINSLNDKKVLSIGLELFLALFSKLKLLFKLYLYMILGRWQKFSRLQPNIFSKNYINKAMFFALLIGLGIFISFTYLRTPFFSVTSNKIEAFININITNLRIPEFILNVISFIVLIVLYPVAAVLFWYILMIISYFVIAIIIFVINNIFIKGIAWILQQPRLHTIIQVSSLILFIFGTIIDFMVS